MPLPSGPKRLYRHHPAMPLTDSVIGTLRLNKTPVGCVPVRKLKEFRMTDSNAITFLMLPPQTAQTRDWAKRLSTAVPGMRFVVAEDTQAADAAIEAADAVFGTLPPELLRRAKNLRWLQAPQAAPPAGYYYPELVAHPVTVTNFREIYNDHISAHILAFVLAFARGLHIFIPQQLRREWKKPPDNQGVVPLPGATALIVGLGGIGTETARLLAAFGMQVLAADARRTDRPDFVSELHPAEALDTLLPRAGFHYTHGAAYPGHRGLFQPRKVSVDAAHRLLHQYRARHDDPPGRSCGRAAGGRNRRCGARCL